MNVLSKPNIYKALVTLGAVGAAQLLNKSIGQGWKKITKKDPPSEQGYVDDWRGLIMWTIFSGILVSLTRLLARRITYLGWARGVGDDPVKYQS